MSLGADPLPAVAKKELLGEVHLSVIARSKPVHEAADAYGFRVQGRGLCCFRAQRHQPPFFLSTACTLQEPMSGWRRTSTIWSASWTETVRSRTWCSPTSSS